MKPNCKDCKYYKPDQNKLTQGFCLFNPPTVCFTMMPTKLGPMPGWQSSPPPVQPDNWCSKFEAKIKVVN